MTGAGIRRVRAIWRAVRAISRAITYDASGRIGVTLVALVMAIAVIGPFVTPDDPVAIVGPGAQRPSSAHWLGTDTLGRDVLSRVLAGGERIFIFPLIALAIAFALGGLLGLVLGYRGGKTDAIGTTVLDVFLGIPPLLTALVVFAGLGTRSIVIILTVGFVFGPRIARVVRGATQSVVSSDYVLAAQLRGERTRAILLREIAPNIAPQLLVEFALRLTWTILFVASLNFLGLGIHPPAPDWGAMIADNRVILTVNPWAAIAAALPIAALSIGVSLAADAATKSVGLGEARASGARSRWLGPRRWRTSVQDAPSGRAT